jgi:transcriptional regulator with GAF, ATPase, and Fis domain
MSNSIVGTPQDLASSNGGQPSLRLRDITLTERIETLREITLSLLTELDSLGSLTAPKSTPERSLNLDDEVKRFEIDLIRAALIKTRGNQALAARLLGVKHTTLNSKIKRYQIRPSRRNASSPVPGAEQEMAA